MGNVEASMKTLDANSVTRGAKIDAAPAWAWLLGKGLLCRWAEPTRRALEFDLDVRKPSPEARPVLVRIIREGDYRRLVKAAKR